MRLRRDEQRSQTTSGTSILVLFSRTTFIRPSQIKRKTTLQAIIPTSNAIRVNMRGGGDYPVVSARIRGIYSTALTKLLLDHDFEIVQPSVPVASCLKLKEDSRNHDLDVFDRKDRQGVSAFGIPQSIQTFRTILFENLIDVIARSPHSSLPDAHRFSIDFEFPGCSKSKLDNIRGSVTPTMRGHHFYKACGGNISSAVDMAENLLTRGESRGEIKRVFNRTIRTFFPFEGSEVEVDHVKLVGSPLLLGKATIDRFDEDKGQITLLRRLKGKGVYDGLGLEKSPGDYAITEIGLGEWCLITRYFSRHGVLKGTYVNLNTPIELYSRRLRYVDLEVDVCVWPDGKMKILDVDALDNAVADRIVGTSLVEFIREKTDELTKELRHIPRDPYQPVR